MSDISRFALAVQRQRHLTHGTNCILSGVIDVSVFVTCDDFFDLHGVAGLQSDLMHCRIAFESLPMGRFIIDVEKQEEIFITADVCINWVVA